MPDENSNMDDLLKAYAKKRREEAGVPLELHPATRQMLQGEVKRTRAKAPTEKPKPSVLLRLWPRLVFGGAIFSVLLGMLFWFQPREKNELQLAQQRSPSAETMAEKKSVLKGEAPLKESVPAPATVAQPPQEKVVADANSSSENEAALGKRFDRSEQTVTITANTAVEGAASTESTSPPPAPAEEPIATRSRELAASSSTDDFKAGLRDENRTTGVPAASIPEKAKVAVNASSPPPAAPAPSVAVAAAAKPENKLQIQEAEFDKADLAKDLRSTNAGLYFVQASPGKNYRQNLSSPPQPAVLTAFHFNQIGNKIQIFDADGSIYEGEVQLMSVAPGSRAELKTRALEETKTKTERAAAKEAQVTTLGGTAQQTFAFQVSGTNRQMNQLVVFNGTFAVTNSPASFAQPAGAFKAGELLQSKEEESRRAQSKRASISNGIIQGKVVIGGTNEFQVKAIQK